MSVQFGTCSEDKRKVNKSPALSNATRILNYSVGSITTPVIQVSKEDCPPTCNYMYISDYDRFYYITDISYDGRFAYVSGKVDVLYSFSDSILETSQYVNRCENNYDEYINDSLITTTVSIPKIKKYGSAFGRTSLGTDNCYLIAVK